MLEHYGDVYSVGGSIDFGLPGGGRVTIGGGTGTGANGGSPPFNPYPTGGATPRPLPPMQYPRQPQQQGLFGMDSTMLILLVVVGFVLLRK